MSTSNQAYLFSLCSALSEKGINPTLATIRNKADRQLAIPEIIKVLKVWKENPQQPVHDETTQSKKSDNREISLENRVEKLESQLIELSDKLQNLIEGLK